MKKITKKFEPLLLFMAKVLRKLGCGSFIYVGKNNDSNWIFDLRNLNEQQREWIEFITDLDCFKLTKEEMYKVLDYIVMDLNIKRKR